MTISVISIGHDIVRALDIDAVKAFVLTAELRSFTRAAEALDLTQPLVSIKLRKLEEHLGRRLLERTPRDVRLSAEGAIFLEAARDLIATHNRAEAAFEVSEQRLAVGISQLLVGNELPRLLSRIVAENPSLRLTVRVGGSSDLISAFEDGDLDAALVLRPDKKAKRSRPVFEERFSWYAAVGWKPLAGKPLPLATQGASCRIRTAAVRALDRAGIAWQEVFLAQGTASLAAAASSGFAIAILPRAAAPAETSDLSLEYGLPMIPLQSVMLYSGLSDPRSRELLRIITAAFQQGR